jgi:hypothetical protein
MIDVDPPYSTSAADRFVVSRIRDCLGFDHDPALFVWRARMRPAIRNLEAARI